MEFQDSFGAAFGRLVKRRRSEQRITQGQLAAKLFPKIENAEDTRKGDISKLENGKVANPQTTTIKKIADILDITEAEIDQLQREAQTPAAQKLDHLNTLSRDALELLASRFDIEKPRRLSDSELVGVLTQKAEDFHRYRAEIEAIDERTKGLGNLKAAAREAAERLDFDEVENLLAMVDITETEIAAQTKMLRASNALMRGRAEQAYTILEAAADSFASLSPLAPSQRRISNAHVLNQHGLRYGGTGMALSIKMLQTALEPLSIDENPTLWAYARNSLGNALQVQAQRTEGPGGTALLNDAIHAHRDALTVYTKANHRVPWAGTQNNLAGALSDQARRNESPDSAALLSESVQAYRGALTVFTKAEHKVKWAGTQQNLGNALIDQAEISKAIKAYGNALEVFTEAEHAVDWAMTQSNLAHALKEKALRSDGPDSINLFNKAIHAYHEALRVRTKAEHPMQWAETKGNLAILVFARANHSATQDPHLHLQAALAYVDEALTKLDSTHTARDHATLTRLRDDILKALSN